MDIETDNLMNDDDMNGDDISISPYNYCDYWCEKCIAQDQCVVYTKEVEAEEEGKNAFEVASENLENAIDMIHQYIEDNNIDIEGMLEEVDDDGSFEKIRQEIQENPLLEMCHIYMERSEEFFEHYRERYLTPPFLVDAFSNLGWYRTLLPVKMERTLHSLYEFAANEEEFTLQDALLTSLVVYKSLRLSLSAVRELKDNLVDYQDILTELEDLLSTINTDLKHEFPFWIILKILCCYLITKPNHPGKNRRKKGNTNGKKN
ncbi:MAG: hypothetical protein NT166_08110 [Candidatus Aminicenantes bacterium]|nr:hypothetical protein [Candidatus Aminicenantes bacterium]